MAAAQGAIRAWPGSVGTTAAFLGAATALAFWLPAPRAPRIPPAAVTAASRPGRWTMLALALGVAGVGGGAGLLALDWHRYVGPGWLVLVTGVCAASLGLRHWDRACPGRQRLALWEWAGLAMLLVVGTWLRFHDYTAFPTPFSTHAIEEQQTGLTGAQILTGLRPWEFPLDTYLTALAQAVSAAPTFSTIRIPFTVASALTILPAYALLRQLVRGPAAFGATFLFAVSSWNLLYSRIAHNIFMPNLFVVTAFALLVDFARTRRLAPVPWLGLLSGYTLYVYAGYRGTTFLVLIGLGGCLVADVWRRWRAAAVARPARPGRDAAALALFLAVVTAVAVPLYVQLRQNTAQPFYYFEAGGRSLANKQYYTGDVQAFVVQRLERLRETAAIFMHRGDGSLTFNDPGRPMLDPVTALCFVGGLALALRHPRRGLNAFWLLTLVALVLVLTVLVQNLDVRRLQGITILVAIFAGLFLDALDGATRRWARCGRAAALAVAVLAGATTVWWTYDVYFVRMAGNARVREAMKNHYTVLIEYGRRRYEAEGGITRHLLVQSLLRWFFNPDYYYGSHYQWLHRPYMAGHDIGDLSDVLPPRPLPSAPRPLSIVVQAPFEREAAAAVLQAVYPGTTCTDVVDPDIPAAAFVVCDLPEAPQARPLRATLHARYWLREGDSGPPVVERDEPFLGYAFVPPSCHDGNGLERCRAEWHGTLDVADPGEYELAVETRGRSKAEVTVDGVPVGGRVRLAAGPHQIEARATLPREVESGVRLLWRRDGGFAVVPFYAADAPQDPPRP